MVDMYHEVMRDYPERIELDESARNMVNKNCLRCHSATMSYVDDRNDNCLKCHSRIAHGSNHLEGGIKIE